MIFYVNRKCSSCGSDNIIIQGRTDEKYGFCTFCGENIFIRPAIDILNFNGYNVVSDGDGFKTIHEKKKQSKSFGGTSIPDEAEKALEHLMDKKIIKL